MQDETEEYEGGEQELSSSNQDEQDSVNILDDEPEASVNSTERAHSASSAYHYNS